MKLKAVPTFDENGHNAFRIVKKFMFWWVSASQWAWPTEEEANEAINHLLQTGKKCT